MKKIDSPFFRRYRFYIISSLVLLVWLIFFDRSSLVKQFEMIVELRSLENQKSFFEKELAKVQAEEKEVLGSDASIEKFAREKYYLKKEGETVFVLVDENDKPIVEED